MNQYPDVSLVIPVFNEGQSIKELIDSIRAQSFQPAEVILVDGGSTDDTIEQIRQLTAKDQYFQVVEAGRAMPGKGRNIGAAKASFEWIAFTDAGIKLQQDWLENLIKKAAENPQASIIYGNYAPLVNTFFEKCATITYVSPALPGKIRGKFIASSLVKKTAWKETGGFPDWRAAEDLVFMEKAEQLGFKTAEAPEAMVCWQLRPDLRSTYQRFELYSKYNVWAGRQAFWHYGVARQYAFLLLPLLLGIFHSGYWFLLIPAWMLARTAKRILLHRHEFGWKPLFNPALFFMVTLITWVIDAATFSGWLKALFHKNGLQTSVSNA